MDYTAQYVDSLIQRAGLNLSEKTEKRLSKSLRAQLVTWVDNNIYNSLTEEQKIDLYHLIDSSKNPTKDVADYFTSIGFDLLEAERTILNKIGDSYVDHLKERFSNLGKNK